MAYYERQPYIQSLHSLLAEVLDGDIRVPRFNRPGSEETWKPEQRSDLLDSIYRGFPIGTLLLWSTTEEIATYGEVGRLKVRPPGDSAKPSRLLLDGHQRVSTLVQVFGRALLQTPPAPDPTHERWFFDLGAAGQDSGDAQESPFVMRPWGAAAGTLLLPLDIVFDRPALNRWVRQHDLTDRQALRVDGVRDRFREYSLPVAVLQADSLDDATESFQRINSGGTRMSRYHMVNALAFGKGFDPQLVWARAKEEVLGGTLWVADDRTAIGDSDLLRICAGLDGDDHPSKIDTRATAGRLTEARIFRAVEAVARATQHLADIGIHSPQTLPYSWQLITLAIYLSGQRKPVPSPAVERWIWLTTYGEVFAGVKSSIYDRASIALASMVDGGDESAMRRDMRPRATDIERFDFRSARARACALSMARHQDRGARDGPAHLALAERGVGALQLLSTGELRSHWWALAIEDEPGRIQAWRRAVSEPASADPRELETLALSLQPDWASVDTLLASRRARLAERERLFVERWGLEWGEP